MKLIRNEEVVQFPMKEWEGAINPTLEYMMKKGWVVYVPSITIPSQEELLENAKINLVLSIQIHLDKIAQSRNYDGILSLCTYVTSTDPFFAAEGQAGVVWRDACWRKGYDIMSDVLQNIRPIPTEEELISELPVINW